MDGYTLMRLMNTAPETAIMVLEDIDAAALARPTDDGGDDQDRATAPGWTSEATNADSQVVHT